MADIEKVKGRLKVHVHAAKANLTTKRQDEYAARLAPTLADDADDATIDAAIVQADSLIDFKAVAKEDDRIKGLETIAAKSKADEKKTDDGKSDEKKTDDNTTEGLLKTLAEGMKTLTEKVTAIETGKVLDQKKQTASQAIEASEAFKKLKPEARAKWVDRIDVNSETSIEDQVKEFETELSELTQSAADGSSYSGPTPKGTGKEAAMSTEEADKIVGDIL